MATTREIDDDKPEPVRASNPSRADKKLLRRALDCFQLAAEADQKQRDREIDDLKFDAGEQWPQDLLTARASMVDPTTGRTLPARPTLTIPKLDGPIQHVVNQQRTANLSVLVKPKGSGATLKQAEKINGLIRHIQVESRAQIARQWAFERAVKVGRGYYRILKDYANDGDYDVDLIVERILNQSSVYIDPSHKQPDASDMEWGFIVEDVPYKRFKREYPKAKTPSTDDFRGEGDGSASWVTYEADSSVIRTVRVAEYWYVEFEDFEIVQTANGYDGPIEDKPRRAGAILNRRKGRKRKVKWVKMTASEILEREDWEGRYIPIIQVIGREYNVNGTRSYKGMVSNGKDAQRSYNYMRSKQVEAVGLAPIAPYVMAEGQDEGYSEMWATANTVPYASLKYKPVTVAGQAAPPPQRVQASTDIGAITQAAAAADDDIKSVTGFSDPSLGRSNPADRSGRAITALQQRSEHGTSDYLDNLTSVSMVHEGRIILDLLPHVYDRVGRVATILDEDLQTSSQIMVNQPYVKNSEGVPRAVPEGTPNAEVLDLQKGIYRVVVAVGKSFKTQREENVSMIGDAIGAAPQSAPLLLDALFENVDAPGFMKYARRFKALLPPAVQAMESKDLGNMPPEAAAQMAAMQGQMQQLQQQAQQMAQTIEQKRVEEEAKANMERFKLEQEMALEREKLAMQERIEMEKIRAGITTADAKGQAARYQEELRAVTRRTQQEADIRAQAIESDAQMAHERDLAELQSSTAMATKAKKP